MGGAAQRVYRTAGTSWGYASATSSSFREAKSSGHRGLDIIPGDVVRFDAGTKVPHMGWNNVAFRRDSDFLKGIPSGSHFYFIHTYYPEIRDESWILGEAEYGVTFPCIVGSGNVIATQFHPEKSHHVGLKIIENFVRKVCS
jgi:glutamine amidotransferase